MWQRSLICSHAAKQVDVLAHVIFSVCTLRSELIESLFGIPGLGSVLVQAIQTGDQPVIMASVFLGSVLYITGLIATDICYALADPRIRLS